jgi:hypothetical protein
MDMDLVHRQIAASAVKHMAQGVTKTIPNKLLILLLRWGLMTVRAFKSGFA